jgi:hypothetical protein
MIKMRRHNSTLAAFRTALFTSAINTYRFIAFFAERFSTFCKALYLLGLQGELQKDRWSIYPAGQFFDTGNPASINRVIHRLKA